MNILDRGTFVDLAAHSLAQDAYTEDMHTHKDWMDNVEEILTQIGIELKKSSTGG